MHSAECNAVIAGPVFVLLAPFLNLLWCSVVSCG